MNQTLYRKCCRKGFRPIHVAEVGVYLPQTSNVLGWILEGVRATLVEAHPDYAEANRNHFAGYKNVTVINKAICDRPGPVVLYDKGASTFLADVPASPARTNDGYQPSGTDAVAVEGVLFGDVDDGTIDLLSVDIEGSEWFVIKHLVSAPKVISLETHGKRYRNPFLREIRAYMGLHEYVLWYQDRSDSVYVLPKAIEITLIERCRALAYAVYLGVRAGRHALARANRG